MAHEVVSRDVQEELMTKKRRRKLGDIPYPAENSPDLLLYDSWNFVFLTSLVRRDICMHTFDSPPRRVLELGCGNGVWIIEAAKKWPVRRECISQVEIID